MISGNDVAVVRSGFEKDRDWIRGCGCGIFDQLCHDDQNDMRSRFFLKGMTRYEKAGDERVNSAPGIHSCVPSRWLEEMMRERNIHMSEATSSPSCR